MFQTHAFDSWTAAAFRHTWFFDVSRHLGGFPARVFLLLAGVSLMLRFDGDRRRGVPEALSRRGAALRGLEVLALGYAFRFTEWVLGLPSLRYVENIFRVDILNCIGMSLILSAYVASPKDLDERRVPWRPLGLLLFLIFLTPTVERYAQLSWTPRFLTSYLAGPKPMAFFPLFPWMAYTLTGCVAGTFWLRASRAGRSGTAMAITLALGVAMAVFGQIGNRAHFSLYHFGVLSGVLTSPIAYLYRTGVCLAGAALAYGVTQIIPHEWFSPLRQLGRTSLLVYWVHIELVYGHLSDPIKGRLNLYWSSGLLVVLMVLMVALSRWRTERFGKPAPGPLAHPVASPGQGIQKAGRSTAG